MSIENMSRVLEVQQTHDEIINNPDDPRYGNVLESLEKKFGSEIVAAWINSGAFEEPENV